MQSESSATPLLAIDEVEKVQRQRIASFIRHVFQLTSTEMSLTTQISESLYKRVVSSILGSNLTPFGVFPCLLFINMYKGRVHDVTYCYNLGKKCVPPY